MDKRCPVCQASVRTRLGASSACCPQCKTLLLHNEHPTERKSLPELTFMAVAIVAVGVAHLIGYEDVGIAFTIVGVGIAFLALHFKGLASEIPNDWQRWKVASPSPRVTQPSLNQIRKPE